MLGELRNISVQPALVGLFAEPGTQALPPIPASRWAAFAVPSSISLLAVPFWALHMLPALSWRSGATLRSVSGRRTVYRELHERHFHSTNIICSYCRVVSRRPRAAERVSLRP